MADLIDTIVYAGRLKEKSALLSSSSGGAFTAISDFFLKNGNLVVAAIYNYENHTTEFQMITDQNICKVSQVIFFAKLITGLWKMQRRLYSLLVWDVNQMDFGSLQN